MKVIGAGVVLLVLVSSFGTVLGAKQCYVCEGVTCNDPYTSQKSDAVTCEHISPNLNKDYACYAISYGIRVQNITTNLTKRSCIDKTSLEKNMTPCDELKSILASPSRQIYGCYSCDKDLCNNVAQGGAVRTSISLFGALGLFLITTVV